MENENYTNVYTYTADGKSVAHDKIRDCCAWLAHDLDKGKSIMAVEIEFDGDDRVVWSKDVMNDVAEQLADDWRESAAAMTDNPHPLAGLVINVDSERYEMLNDGTATQPSYHKAGAFQ